MPPKKKAGGRAIPWPNAASPPSDTSDVEAEAEEEQASDSDVSDGEGGVEFRPAEVLPNAHFHRRTIQDIVELVDSPYLELNPAYQRDVVWSQERMIKLINSLFGQYYIPPLIFNVHRTISPTDGREIYMRRSIDGKQRITSIHKFAKGLIPCTDARNRRWYLVDDPTVSSSSRSVKRILPASWRNRFLNMELLVTEYADLNESTEEDLFSRVQLGMPLTPAEKLKASTGPWQQLAIEVERKYPKPLSTIDNKRARGFQLILQILRQLATTSADDGPQQATYTSGAGALKGFCNRTTLLTSDVRKSIDRVFATYSQLVERYPHTFENHNYTHSTKFSPIEFVGVAVLIDRFSDRNVALLSGDVLLMREHLRNHMQDLRTNTKTWRCLMNFVGQIERYRGSVNTVPKGPNHIFGAADEGASTDLFSSTQPPPLSSTQKKDSRPSGLSTKKRVRAADEAPMKQKPNPKKARAKPTKTVESVTPLFREASISGMATPIRRVYDVHHRKGDRDETWQSLIKKEPGHY